MSTSTDVEEEDFFGKLIFKKIFPSVMESIMSSLHVMKYKSIRGIERPLLQLHRDTNLKCECNRLVAELGFAFNQSQESLRRMAFNEEACWLLGTRRVLPSSLLCKSYFNSSYEGLFTRPAGAGCDF